ncbi:MAG: SusC/RagA family TonB-linked outer membrane protein [Bacteroidota bacterium]|nr:SusC/RagA family TonB-linked outer membrane protein [Bacteroidota bacterium]
MKRLYTYIVLPLLLAGSSAAAQELSVLDQISLGNPFELQANVNQTAGSDIFDKSYETDISNALYGQFSGLLVKTGSSTYTSNQAKLKLALRLHGHSPIILVDGFPRSVDDLTGIEIESVTVLKDAAAAALYGVKGGDGVVMITTKRGQSGALKVTASYQYGFQQMFRAPEFADGYTYGFMLNEARSLDGLPAKYSDAELRALYDGTNPYAYPSVDWWNEIYRNHGDVHHAELTFTGGNRNFRYFSAIDYYKEDFLYRNTKADDRYNSKHYDNRINIRANVDVNLTPTTGMKFGVVARLSEFNKGNYEDRLEEVLYKLPSAAFPVRQADGVYGGSSIYGNVNPVAMMEATGQKLYSQTKVLADANIRQDLGMVVPGMWADASVAFDYVGRLSEDATRTYRYSEITNPAAALANPSAAEQAYYGVDSKILDFDHWFSSLQMKFEVQGRLNWMRNFDKHHVSAHAAYRQRSWVYSGQNNSSKTQEILGSVSYNWNERIFADAVLNYSGSAYLPEGHRFNLYPAISVAGVILTGEPYLKAYASAGISGSDGDLKHELWFQNYSSGNDYYFGPNGGSGYSGRTEGDLAALTLSPERSSKVTLGSEAKFFGKRLEVTAEAFYEKRDRVLISPENISDVIGVGISKQSLGEQNYRGADLSIAWNDKVGEVEYGAYANGGWLYSKVVNDGQAFQLYDYLYHKGNPVDQKYGLEVLGFFRDQAEIDASPKQTFGDVRPGDIKYRDVNEDGVVDDQDKVKMFHSSTPMMQFGFGLHASWKGFTVYADFQGMSGVTVDLSESPLYTPLKDNGTISKTFLNREVTWAPGREDKATMPRLTSLSDNSNNYKTNSLWLRDGSFLKLRNVGISYKIPRKALNICDATISLAGTNLFSLDNIGFADPEQMGAYYPSTRTFWAGVKFNF